METSSADSSDGLPALSEFVRHRQADILRDWERAVRRRPVKHGLDRLAHIDEIPILLERIAEVADDLAVGDASGPARKIAHVDGIGRGDSGFGGGFGGRFDLLEVVTELTLLRDCIGRLWAEQERPLGECERLLHAAVDGAIAKSVESFTRARDAAFQALDFVSAAALESPSTEDLLRLLLRVLVKAVPAVESAAIFLASDDDLRLEAAVGVEQETRSGFSLKIGEGFVGRIARDRRPLSLRAEAAEPSIQREVSWHKGARTLYGVPLLFPDELIGVAVMGSPTVKEFSERDKRLFAALARHATRGICRDRPHAQAHEERARPVRMREDIIGKICHDLRNPLNVVSGGITLLLAKASGDHRTRTLLDAAWRGVCRMDQLIGDLLDTACIQAGELLIESKPCDAASVIAEAIRLHETAGGEQSIHLDSHVSVGTSSIPCDRERILQVFSQLLGNATKFSEPGRSITVHSELLGQELRVAVADTGPGIAEEELPHIFEPCRSTDVKRGAGLGLFIAKGIIEAHRGRLWTESRLGLGTTFFFTLPLAEARATR